MIDEDSTNQPKDDEKTRDGEKEDPQQELNKTQDDNADSCPICMDPWTLGSAHAICSLRCGHLFGRSCIEKWIGQGSSKCPNCNKPAKKSDLRNIFCKSVIATDNTEIIQYKRLLDEEQKSRKKETAKHYHDKLKLQMAYEDIDRLKKELEQKSIRLLKLESKFEELFKNNTAFSHDNNMEQLVNPSDFVSTVKPVELKGTFNKISTLECIHIGKCTSVLASSTLAVVAQPTPHRARNPFGDFGLRKYSIADMNANEFIPLHLKEISAFDLKRSTDLAITSSEDKKIKITSLSNNNCVHSYDSTYVPSCISWSSFRDQQFFVGYANCYVALFDMRNTQEAIYTSPRVANTRLISGSAVGKTNSDLYGFLMNDIKGCHLLEFSETSSYNNRSIDEPIEHSHYYSLPFAGKMGTLDYDEKSGLSLITTRVNQEATNCVHNLVELSKREANEDERDLVEPKMHRSFVGGKCSSLLTQSRILRHPTKPESVLVASNDEEARSIIIWDASDNTVFQKIRSETIRSISMPVSDEGESNMFYALGDRNLSLYRWDYA